MVRQIAVGYGIALGVIGYFATGRASATALIPSGFGLLITLCGALAFKENLRKHIMHVAVVLSVIAMGGAGFRVVKSGALTGGDVGPAGRRDCPGDHGPALHRLSCLRRKILHRRAKKPMNFSPRRAS